MRIENIMFSLSAEIKQHVGMIANSLYFTVASMFESTFFCNRVVKIWKSLPAMAENFAILYGSLNP